MKKYLEKTINNIRSIESESKLVVYLEAGHYSPKTGATDFSEHSFLDAIFLAKSLIREYGKNIKIVFGVLVDDLGLVCGGGTCQMGTAQTTSSKPFDDLIEQLIADEAIIKRDRVLRFSERTTKNRGIETLRKLMKREHPNLVVSTEDDCSVMQFQNQADKPIVLARKRADAVSIQCPGIMNQHYSDVLQALRKRFFESDNFVIIDWSELYDESKVRNGVDAFFQFMAPTDVNCHISNIFFGDDEGDIYKLFSKTNCHRELVA